MRSMLIPQRFNGPAGTGNGGYVCGRLASFLPPDATVTVTLRRPPPLERELDVEVTDTTVVGRAGDDVVAQADVAAAGALGEPVPTVDVSTAASTAVAFEGHRDHPFPTCFVCGTDRDDGLHLYAGPVPGRQHVTAAVFEPRTDLLPPGTAAPALIRAEFVWAALDCPGGWSIGLPGRPAVLGRMTARVDALPAVGERCVVVGALDRWEGRKAFTRTAVYDGDGRCIARAAATWIELARP